MNPLDEFMVLLAIDSATQLSAPCQARLVELSAALGLPLTAYRRPRS